MKPKMLIADCSRTCMQLMAKLISRKLKKYTNLKKKWWRFNILQNLKVPSYNKYNLCWTVTSVLTFLQRQNAYKYYCSVKEIFNVIAPFIFSLSHTISSLCSTNVRMKSQCCWLMKFKASPVSMILRVMLSRDFSVDMLLSSCKCFQVRMSFAKNAEVYI